MTFKGHKWTNTPCSHPKCHGKIHGEHEGLRKGRRRGIAGMSGHTMNWEPCRKCGKIHGPPKPNVPREIDLTPNFDLGWITGIVLGDGNIIKDHRCFVTRLGSTRKDYVSLFAEVVAHRFTNLHVGRYDELKTWKTPSGKWMTAHVYWARVYSKRLFELWKPHKLEDFHWTIPPLVQSNGDIKRGFLQGIFDAEGSIWTDGKYRHEIQIVSKHKSNLEPIQPMLTALGMRSTWDMHLPPPHTVLRLSGRNQCIQFRNKIGFKLPEKAAALLPIAFKRRWKGMEQLPWEMKTEW